MQKIRPGVLSGLFLVQTVFKVISSFLLTSNVIPHALPSAALFQNNLSDKHHHSANQFWRHCVESLSNTHLSVLSSGSTQEDQSRHNWNIVVGRKVSNQIPVWFQIRPDILPGINLTIKYRGYQWAIHASRCILLVPRLFWLCGGAVTYIRQVTGWCYFDRRTPMYSSSTDILLFKVTKHIFLEESWWVTDEIANNMERIKEVLINIHFDLFYRDISKYFYRIIFRNIQI